MKEEIEHYLARKPTQWLESELEQAHAQISDESADIQKRESALAASVMLANEIARRKNA
jgi:hypothetical protein